MRPIALLLVALPIACSGSDFEPGGPLAIAQAGSAGSSGGAGSSGASGSSGSGTGGSSAGRGGTESVGGDGGAGAVSQSGGVGGGNAGGDAGAGTAGSGSGSGNGGVGGSIGGSAGSSGAGGSASSQCTHGCGPDSECVAGECVVLEACDCEVNEFECGRLPDCPVTKFCGPYDGRCAEGELCAEPNDRKGTRICAEINYLNSTCTTTHPPHPSGPCGDMCENAPPGCNVPYFSCGMMYSLETGEACGMCSTISVAGAWFCGPG